MKADTFEEVDSKEGSGWQRLHWEDAGEIFFNSVLQFFFRGKIGQEQRSKMTYR